MLHVVAVLALMQSPCALPVYLRGGGERCAKEPASFAFGRVVWMDAELGYPVTVPVARVDMARTQPIHEAARDRALKGGTTGRGITMPGEATGEESAQAAPPSAPPPVWVAPELRPGAPRPVTTREKMAAAVERAAAKDAYDRAVARYIGGSTRPLTPTEEYLRELVRQQRAEELRAAAERLRRAEEAVRPK